MYSYSIKVEFIKDKYHAIHIYQFAFKTQCKRDEKKNFNSH